MSLESDEFQKIADELQAAVLEDAREVYSETVIDHAMNPRNAGTIANADGYGEVKGSCGDTMELWLRVNNAVITHATFLTDGCGTSIAAGSMVTEMARGKNITEAIKISQQDILNELEGLPEESKHCALLASNTLKKSILDYMALQREPWKKAYRNH
ncbi:MAG: iron-sulfur cluster assembly scaffold protein [Dehalococcoidales bacterium]|nr:iron-sulfur cluster assembly scaffold protein [Dehalococcoidales bacterium]